MKKNKHSIGKKVLKTLKLMSSQYNIEKVNVGAAKGKFGLSHPPGTIKLQQKLSTGYKAIAYDENGTMDLVICTDDEIKQKLWP